MIPSGSPSHFPKIFSTHKLCPFAEGNTLLCGIDLLRKSSRAFRKGNAWILWTSTQLSLQEEAILPLLVVIITLLQLFLDSYSACWLDPGVLEKDSRNAELFCCIVCLA